VVGATQLEVPVNDILEAGTIHFSQGFEKKVACGKMIDY